MPTSFSVEQEQQLQRKERREFLHREIEYFKFACEQMGSQGDAGFYESSYEYARRLSGILESLEKYEQFAEAEKDRGLRILESAEGACVSLPALFQILSNSVVSRRITAVRATASATRRRFALTEVHPDYGMTVRAIEGLNSRYHELLKPFFGKFSVVSPLVVISPSSKYAFSVAPLFDVEMFRLDADFNAAVRKELIEHLLNLSWIILPRWVPVQVRNAPILAHENWHRVLCLALLAMGDLDEFESSRPGATERKDEQFVRDLYGPLMGELARRLKFLATGLAELLYQLRRPRIHAVVRQFPKATRDSVFQEYYDIILDSALNLAEEFLADVGATMLAGPAFVFALIADPKVSVSEISITRDPSVEMKHPPLVVRAKVLRFVLRHLGFRRMATKTTQLIAEFQKQSKPQNAERVLLREFEGWLRRNKPFFTEIVEIMSSTMPACLGNRLLRRPSSVAPEYQWIREMEHTRKMIAAGGRLSIDTTPEEVLNSVWIKKIEHPRLGPLHLGWRTVLYRLYQTLWRDHEE